ncbi:MAG: inositol monophosphatase family protein [Bosea sp. (in: a-proteobacteria)]
MIRSPLMTVMTDAVIKASRTLKRDFGEVEQLQVLRKGPGDFVSKADHRAEEILRETLEKARPGYGFILEEGGVVDGTDKANRWHIDPLDGTSNFLHGIPHFNISVGLEREGQMVAGVVYDPIKDEMFIAEKGKGAFINNKRCRVSGRTDPTEMLIGIGSPNLKLNGQPVYLRELASVLPRFGNVRRYGAAALDIAYVACGRLDGFYERNLHSWDYAAASVLIREAGGTLGTLDGKAIPESRDIICGNEAAERELRAALKAAV